MALIAGGYINQEKLDSEIERIKLLLGPEVVRLKHTLGEDHNGEPSIHFRIVLTDSASREEVLGAVTGQISQILYDELRPYENWGLHLYTSVRSQSEQAKRADLDIDWV